MLVWHDTQKRRQQRPSWLPAAPAISRVHTQHGDLLCVGEQHAAMLGWRDDVEWVDAGEGWNVAIYGGDPCLPELIRKDQSWTLLGVIVDGRGKEWHIPCMLFPSDNNQPGAPMVAQLRKLTADGWVREPLHEIQRAALDACYAAWPHLDNLGGWNLDEQGSAMAAIIEAVLHCSGLGLARLGLFDDVVVEKGLKLACGKIDPRKADQ